MKKLSNYLIAMVLVLLVSSCGVGIAILENQNQNSTQVHLAEDNYTVTDRVSGTAEVDYVLIFGGWKKRQLYADAYSKMLDAANLESGSRAVVNLLTEEHVGGFPPFYTKRTITVSAHVIEFNE